MAFVANELFRQDFTSTDTITVTHNLNREQLDVKLLVGAEARNDLIRRVLVTPANPRNEFKVNLESAQTGTIQVLEIDKIGIGDEAATEQYLGHLFGQYYTYAEDIAESTTTGGTFVQKLRLTTPNIATIDNNARFLLNWSFVFFNATEEGGDFEAQIEQDDTTQLWLMTWDHTWEDEAGDSGNRWPAAGFREVTLPSGIHTFDLDFRNPSAGTAIIGRATMSFWRVF